MLAGMQRFGTAVSVTYLSRRNPFRPCSKSATLLQVARMLSTQLHRVPVVDESGKCIAIISQSSLIQFLNSQKAEIADDLRQTIGSLSLGMCKVVSVASDASAWQAFKTLEVNSVSGIAIVDREGKLVGNTSARDLKFFVLNKGTLSLDAPIQDYLSRIRQRDLAHEEARHPSCSVGLSTTLGHCIGLLAATGYHRVSLRASRLLAVSTDPPACFVFTAVAHLRCVVHSCRTGVCGGCGRSTCGCGFHHRHLAIRRSRLRTADGGSSRGRGGGSGKLQRGQQQQQREHIHTDHAARQGSHFARGGGSRGHASAHAFAVAHADRYSGAEPAALTLLLPETHGGILNRSWAPSATHTRNRIPRCVGARSPLQLFSSLLSLLLSAFSVHLRTTVSTVCTYVGIQCKSSTCCNL